MPHKTINTDFWPVDNFEEIRETATLKHEFVEDLAKLDEYSKVTLILQTFLRLNPSMYFLLFVGMFACCSREMRNNIHEWLYPFMEDWDHFTVD